MRYSSAFVLASAALTAVVVTAQYNNPFSSTQFPLIVQVPVHLVVQAGENMIFDGQIVTHGHDITTPAAEDPHHCDGTNGDRCSVPGATCTTALADAAAQAGFAWDA